MTALTLFGLIMAHFVGDYILQSNWMAQKKTTQWWPAIAHGLTYTLPFLFVTQSLPALLVIGGTHVLIDHWRLAKYVNFGKNWLLAPPPARPSYAEAMQNGGFSKDTPIWLSSWLLFIADNTIHVLINAGAVLFLG